MPVLGFLRTLLYVCLWGQTPVLFWFRLAKQLALPPSAALHLFLSILQCFPSLFATHGNAFLSSPVLLTFTWSPFSNFSEKVNAAPLAAAESALMLLCQPGPASLLCRSLYLILTSPHLLLLASTSHQVATHSSIGDSFQLWHHTTLHEPSILAQINLIGPWIWAERKADPEKNNEILLLRLMSIHLLFKISERENEGDSGQVFSMKGCTLMSL